MKLVILDIDGTLTATNHVDTDCFVSAFTHCFGVAVIETDWALYPHATDSGIMQELFIEHFGRGPSQQEIAQMRRMKALMDIKITQKEQKILWLNSLP